MEKLSRYNILKPLGKEGGFSNIFLGFDNEKKRDVIIKKIDKLKTKEELFNREIEIIKKMKCKNSVEYYDHYNDNDYYYIIMEKCDEDLNDFLEKNNGSLSETMIKNILIQLNEAFKAMHSNNIIHRDLKPENILIKYNSSDNNDFTVKLADFGISREYNKKYFSTHMGTQGYAAPEVIENKNYDPKKCDLWAIGVIIYKLKFNEIPILKFYGNKVPNKFDNEYLDDLVKKLIVVDQSKRISWEDYFNHEFFKEKITIIVANTTNKRDKIEIDKFSKVSDLKKKIIEKFNLNSEKDLTCLTYAGMILEDNQSIDETDIEEWSVLFFVGKYYGG